jgi:hypothetical protein
MASVGTDEQAVIDIERYTCACSGGANDVLLASYWRTSGLRERVEKEIPSDCYEIQWSDPMWLAAKHGKSLSIMVLHPNNLNSIIRLSRLAFPSM